MIIPYTHENLEARRWPIVTVTLIVLNVVCLIVLNSAMSGQAERVEAIGEQALAYREAHPKLEDNCAPLADIPRHRPRYGDRYDARERYLEREREETMLLFAPRDPERLAAEQAEYDGLCKQLEDVIADVPTHHYGYVPGENNLLGLITYQFLHGGWVHLLSNLWFLWLCGCNLEDRWGRLVFIPFYLSAGVAAALTQKLFTPTTMIPLVGASGAIAGLMGAFLVAFANTRIKFFYVFFMFRWGTFTAPAFVMLPLWLVTEIFWGMVGGSGVAHWAHVGGFVYGAAVAVLLKQTGIEHHLDKAVEETITTTADPRILQAGDLINAGSANEAIAILLPLAVQQPRNIDVQLELLRAAKVAKNPTRELAAYVKLIELYFDSGAPDTAADLFAEMYGLGLQGELTRGWTLKIAENLVSRSLYDRANTAYATACREGLVDVVSVRATLAHARVLLRLGRVEQARDLFMAARESPFSSAEIDAVIDAEMAKLGSAA